MRVARLWAALVTRCHARPVGFACVTGLPPMPKLLVLHAGSDRLFGSCLSLQ